MKSGWDDTFHTTNTKTKVKWKDADAELISFRAQYKTTANMFTKIKGGYVTDVKHKFLLYAKDVINSEGRYILERGDKIVKMIDLKGTRVVNFELFVKEIVNRGVYDKINFIELLCEKQVPKI